MATAAAPPNVGSSSLDVGKVDEGLAVTSDCAKCFVCDTSNNAIRMIDLNMREVTTLMGGPRAVKAREAAMASVTKSIESSKDASDGGSDGLRVKEVGKVDESKTLYKRKEYLSIGTYKSHQGVGGLKNWLLDTALQYYSGVFNPNNFTKEMWIKVATQAFDELAKEGLIVPHVPPPPKPHDAADDADDD
jgi:hypothetical protein